MKWEYLVEWADYKHPYESLKDALNRYGEQGWELVSVERHEYKHRSDPGSDVNFYCILKRPK